MFGSCENPECDKPKRPRGKYCGWNCYVIRQTYYAEEDEANGIYNNSRAIKALAAFPESRQVTQDGKTFTVPRGIPTPEEIRKECKAIQIEAKEMMHNQVDSQYRGENYCKDVEAKYYEIRKAKMR